MAAQEPYDVVLEISSTKPSATKGFSSSDPRNVAQRQQVGRVDYVSAKIPDDGVGFSIESDWSTPFAEISGGTIGQLLSLVGTSVRFQQASLHVWGGSSPIRISIPFEFQAQADAVQEVLTPMAKLMMLAAPKLTSGGNTARFEPPGPTLANIADILKNLNSPVAQQAAQVVQQNTSGGEFLALFVGDFFYLDNVIIRSVTPHFYSVMDPNGIPMKGSCQVVFESYLTPARDQIVTYFRNRVGATS